MFEELWALGSRQNGSCSRRTLGRTLVLGCLASLIAAAPASPSSPCGFPLDPYPWRAQLVPAVWSGETGVFTAYFTDRDGLAHVELFEVTSGSPRYLGELASDVYWPYHWSLHLSGHDGTLIGAWSDERLEEGWSAWIARYSIEDGAAPSAELVRSPALVFGLTEVAGRFVLGIADGYGSPTDIVFLGSDDDGVTWTHLATLSTPFVRHEVYPRLASSGSTLYVLYRVALECDDCPLVLLMRSTDRGNTWSEVRSFTGAEIGTPLAEIAVAGDHVAVVGSISNRPRVFYSDDAGTSWEPHVDIVPDVPTAFSAAKIAVGGGGSWHLVGKEAWTSEDETFVPLLHTRSPDRGLSWSRVDTLNCTSNSHGPSFYYVHTLTHPLDITSNPDGPVVVVWPRLTTRTGFRSEMMVSTVEGALVAPDPPPDGDDSFRVEVLGNPRRSGEALHMRVHGAGASRVTASIYSVEGRQLRGWEVPSGGAEAVTIEWDGLDALKRPVGPGVFFWEVVEAGTGQRKVERVVLLP